MAKRLPLLLLFVALFLTGCVPIDSLNSIYTDSDVIFDAALLGHWTSGQADESLRVERGENNSYLVIVDKKDQGAHQENVYEAHLVNLGGDKYFDVVPKTVLGAPAAATFQMDAAKKASRFAPALQRITDGLYIEVLGPTPGKATIKELQINVRPVHWFFRVEIHQKSLSLNYLDDEWVEKAIKKHYIQASHMAAPDADDGKDWVLTGSTAELQSLIVRAADDPGAFGGGMAFQKIK